MHQKSYMIGYILSSRTLEQKHFKKNQKKNKHLRKRKIPET